MAKYVKTGDLQTGTVYEFEVTYDSYVYKASAQFPAQWVWTLTFLSATGKDVNGDDVPMAGNPFRIKGTHLRIKGHRLRIKELKGITSEPL